MIKNAEHIERNKRERFELMAVRLAHHLNMSRVETFSDLPPNIRQHFEGLSYLEIVHPLIVSDHSHGLSIRQLSVKYGVAKSTIQIRVKK